LTKNCAKSGYFDRYFILRTILPGTHSICSRQKRAASPRRNSLSADNLRAEQASEASGTAARSAACAVTRQMPLDCCLLQVQREAWATDLDLPAFAVTAEQAAEQAAEVSSTAARSAACAVTHQMPRRISRSLTAGQRPT